MQRTHNFMIVLLKITIICKKTLATIFQHEVIKFKKKKKTTNHITYTINYSNIHSIYYRIHYQPIFEPSEPLKRRK